MKNFYLPKYMVLAIICLSFTFRAFSQVPMPITVTAGWNGLATAKWDNLNYLVTTGNYAGYVTPAMSTTQAFAIGTNRMTIVMAGGITTLGQNNLNSGNANSYGTASAIITNGGTTLNSVSYNGNGTITITFDTVASHVGFSLYDIDQSQTANVTAKDASGNPLNITMSNAAAVGPINTITGSGTTSATATPTNANVATNSNTASVNVYVDGFTPAGRNGVKSITITTAGNAGDFWLSDIIACVYKGFPNNYYLPAKPYTGQPAFTIANSNAPSASRLNVAQVAGGNNAKYIFTDNAAGNPYVNSFGYDIFNHYLYYTLDYTTSTAGSVKSIKKYDFNTLGSTTATMSSGTISTLIADVTVSPFNIPVFDQGVSSGGGAFYNGSYYIGIEGANAYVKIGGKFSASSRPSMIWRIDFNSSGTPTQACQVYAVKADNGSGTLLHDWSDFGINNGILYDFNGAGGTSNTRFYHYNLQTGLIANSYSPNGSPVPSQCALDWNGNLYNLLSSSDLFAQYNLAGGIGTQYAISGSNASDWTAAGAGDASEPFLPPIDYGDAPASYDPVSGDPAAHDFDSTLKLGTLWNAEFAKKTTADASGDGTTDDGILGIPVFTWGVTTYSVTAKVYNHTGANATLAGWIDVNNNGVFETGEGITVNVPSSATMQNVVITWPSLGSIAVSVTHVFMRIRLTSATNTMTAANPTGYFSNGEVEDYYVQVLSVLPVNLLSFSATPMEDKYVKLAWEVTKETDVKDYSILRSSDGVNWVKVAEVQPGNAFNLVQQYSTDDLSPLDGTSYYKLQLNDNSGSVKFSETQKIKINGLKLRLGEISPNPFNASVKINVVLPEDGKISYRIVDVYGKTLVTGSTVGFRGNNTFNINSLGNLSSGIYLIQLNQNAETVTQKLVKN